MSEHKRGLLDTSVVIDLPDVPIEDYIAEGAVSTITLGELAVGTNLTDDPIVRAKRTQHMQQVENSFDVLDFDGMAARFYGYLYMLVLQAGRKPRGRTADLMIAATAASDGIPLLTRNPKDFVGLESMVKVISL